MSRSILITGAGRGIGAQAAILAGRRGWSVAVNYRENANAAAATVAAVQQAGGKAKAIQGDVVNEADVLAMFDAAEAAFAEMGAGTLDGVVVNAGIVAPKASVAEMDAARLKHVFDTNILGAFLCAREAARRLPGRAGAGIVLISSIAARLGSPGEYVDYAASKAAVDTLGLGLAKELAPLGVRVNVLRPGLIDTEIHASGGQPGRAQRLGKTVPLGREGRPEEIAEGIIWLLDDASSYVVGAMLDISGGR